MSSKTKYLYRQKGHAATPQVQDHHLLPAPKLFEELQQVKQEEGRDMSELVREALRLYMEDRELRRQQRLERLRSRLGESADNERGEIYE